MGFKITKEPEPEKPEVRIQAEPDDIAEIVDKLDVFTKEIDDVLKKTEKLKRLVKSQSGYISGTEKLTSEQILIETHEALVDCRSVFKDIKSGLVDIRRRTMTWHDITVRGKSIEEEV